MVKHKKINPNGATVAYKLDKGKRVEHEFELTAGQLGGLRGAT